MMNDNKVSLPEFTEKQDIVDDLKQELDDLFTENVEEKTYCYAIIDCAQFDSCFYKMFIKDPNLICCSLLANTPYVKSSEAGPLLIQIEKYEPSYQNIINEILIAQVEKPSVLWLWSKASFFSLQDYLKELLFAENEQGKKYFLRFYDPRCFNNMLELFKADKNISYYLEKIESWAILCDDQYLFFNKDNHYAVEN